MKQSYYDRPGIASNSPIMTGQVAHQTVMLRQARYSIKKTYIDRPGISSNSPIMIGQVSHQTVLKITGQAFHQEDLY